MKTLALDAATIAELWGEEHSGKTLMVRNFAEAIEKELLAQSEQTTQEPVAWMYKCKDEVGITRYKTFYSKDLDVRLKLIPLYTSPAKREPLDDGQIADGCRANKNATHPDSFWAGVRYTEKIHGIEEEEPLSLEDVRVIINQLPTCVDLDTGIEFCRIIEKAHGIGE